MRDGVETKSLQVSTIPPTAAQSAAPTSAAQQQNSITVFQNHQHGCPCWCDQCVPRKWVMNCDTRIMQHSPSQVGASAFHPKETMHNTGTRKLLPHPYSFLVPVLCIVSLAVLWCTGPRPGAGSMRVSLVTCHLLFSSLLFYFALKTVL